MVGASRISFDSRQLREAKRRIPAADFVGPQYDVERGVETNDVLIVLSTPRSGSTLLCELLRLNQACLAHEYFQPHQYMPLLAERWGCLRSGTLDELAYIESLCRFRTHRSGWLGINLHGSHLKYFTKMEGHLPPSGRHYVHLLRRDVIRQAISYHIASQTRQWSSEFDSEVDPVYDYAKIRNRLQRIHDESALIQAFLIARGLDHRIIHYEDLVADPEATLRSLPCIPSDVVLRTKSTLRRQAGKRNADWTSRFARDVLEHDSESDRRGRARIWKRAPRLLGVDS